MSRNKWTEEDDVAVREDDLAGISIKATAERLGRTQFGITNRRQKLDVAIHFSRWTEEDDAAIREDALAGSSIKATAERLGRTSDSITSRRYTLGVAGRRPWTKEQDARLRSLCGRSAVHDWEPIAKAVGRSVASCITRRRERRLLRARTPDETLYAGYVRGARIRGLSFLLSRAQVRLITSLPCSYCFGEGGGIDRVDNAIGYETPNCVPCCATCNRMKMALSLYEFKAHILRIAAVFIRENAALERKREA